MSGARRRILVIEDDAETARQLADFLGASGYHTDLALNGKDGLQLGLSDGYAVMTIDRMLPGIDGLALIRHLRDAGIVTPALIISALGEVDDRVRGLRSGGDDYLVKPFAFAELLARIEALARRSTIVVKETVLRVGDLELDLVSRTVNRGGKKIDLLPREFQVLEYLVRNEGQVGHAPCCCSKSGICNSTRQPTSSMFMSGGFPQGRQSVHLSPHPYSTRGMVGPTNVHSPPTTLPSTTSAARTPTVTTPR